MKKKVCMYCGGKGYYKLGVQNMLFGQGIIYQMLDIYCYKCKGSGKVKDNKKR